MDTLKSAVKSLYMKSARLNLYVSCVEKRLNPARLKAEIVEIEQAAENIRKILDIRYKI